MVAYLKDVKSDNRDITADQIIKDKESEKNVRPVCKWTFFFLIKCSICNLRILIELQVKVEAR